MNSDSREFIEIILRECELASPNPWYPGEYTQATGVSRDVLDPYLDELRLGGLVELTPWQQGKGQGYALTETGARVLQSPRMLTRIRKDSVPAQTASVTTRAQPSTIATTMDRGEAVRQALLGQGMPPVTRTLLFLNIGVFVVGWALAVQRGVPAWEYITAHGDGGVLAIQLQTGMLSRPHVFVLDQWWRIVSCFFVHIGALHIAMNMYFLYIIGPMAERMYGSVRFVVLYLFAGIAASYAALIFSDAELMAGASGALCGLLGSLPVWVLINKRHLPPNLVQNWMQNIFVNIILIVVISMLPRVSAAGHFGGGIAGALIAGPLVASRFARPPRRMFGMLGAAALFAILIIVGFGGHVRSVARERLAADKASTAFSPARDFWLAHEQKFRNEKWMRQNHDTPASVQLRKEIKKHLESIRPYSDISGWCDHGRTTRNAALIWLDLFGQVYKGLDPKTEWSSNDAKQLEAIQTELVEWNNRWVGLPGITKELKEIENQAR